MSRNQSGSSHTPRLLGVEAQGEPRVSRPDHGSDAGVVGRANVHGRRASGVAHAGPGSPLAALMATFERRAIEAEQVQATAPVAAVLRAVLADLAALDDARASGDPPDVARDDHLLTAPEVAARLGTTVKWVFRARLPFRVRLSPRNVRFSAAGLEKWLARR